MKSNLRKKQCALGYQAPNTTPLFLAKLPPYPSLNLQTVQATLFRQFHPILIFRALPFNIGFFCEHQKYQSFSSFTPSHILKITKFLAIFFYH